MPQFASKTEVPVERTRAEIEEALRSYGASEFQTGWNANSSMVAFRIKSLYIRFVLPLPDKTDDRFCYKKTRGNRRILTGNQSDKVYEQDVRSRWRALLLVIKAKLEAIARGISSVEAEFLAFIVMPNQQTLGEWIIDVALPMIRHNQMPRLALPPPRKNDDVQDAEFTEAGP